MKRSNRIFRFALTAAFCFATISCASAEDRALINACFSPSALAKVPGEEIAVKGNHLSDTPPSLDGVTMAPSVPPELRGAIRRVDVPAGQKVIALTFDLCEQRGEVAGYDGRIIDYLREQNVKATLFAGGKWMASHRARTEQLMLDPLFEIGDHTETHRNLRLASPAAARQEILAPIKTYEMTRAHLAANQCMASRPDSIKAVAAEPTLFRFPYGACNDATLKDVNDAGMLAIQWDVATGDPDPNVSAKAIADAMVREAKPGSIIVSHANGRGWHTAQALPLAIPKLKAKGYAFVTVSELITMGKPVIVSECYDRKPGDTKRYDTFSGLEHPLNPAAEGATSRSAPWGTVVTKSSKKAALSAKAVHGKGQKPVVAN